MRRLERLALLAGLVVASITMVYRHVLTDEQRAAAREATEVIRNATQDVADSVSPLVSNGPTRKEERAAAEANRARTAAQWESLGY